MTQAKPPTDTSSIYFGQCITKDGQKIPMRVPRQDFAKGHMHIRGRTRSGKTSMAIIPLASQLMAPYPDPTDHSAKPRMLRDPVFVFDLGGDQALFWTLKEMAKGYGRSDEDFKFLSLRRDDAWHFFDPFQAVQRTPGGGGNTIRLANLFIEAFNLDNGLIYGGQYFTQQNLAALLDVVRAFFKYKGHPPTLHEIADYLDNLRFKRQKAFRDADQIRMTFNFLLEYPQLQPNEQDKASGRVIDMAKALDNPNGEVVYFFTPTLNESTTARQIAGLGLYSVINAAIEKRRREPDAIPPHQHIWIFVDEFHELAGRSFASLLAQAGKFGITLILANQTTDQLENRDTSLAQVVFDNCHIKQYFTVTSSRDIEDLQVLSKDDKFLLATETLSGMDSSTSKREVLLPILTKNEILDVSTTKGHTFLIVDDGKGHREPQCVEVKYATMENEYLAHSHKRLPPRPTAPDDISIPKRPPRATVTPVEKTRPTRNTPPPRMEALKKLLESKRHAETPA
jgi:Type IV secretion-system coupling protein DNA-binding domain